MYKKPCRVYVPCGCLGNAGLTEEQFQWGLDMKPDIIATDAGSTDSGPYYLGSGKCKHSENIVKYDCRQFILGAHKLGIPFVVGSVQTSGTDSGVDYFDKMVRDILAEEGIAGKKIVKIYSEQSSEVLKQKYREGKITPLPYAPEIDETTFEKCSHIVALAGAEPFMKALAEGADIVICGRSTDTAELAALPLLWGCHEGAAWHAAKIAECGAQCAVRYKQPGGVVFEVDDEGFTITAADPNNYITEYSAAAHMIYENANPFQLPDPGHILDVTEAVYKALPDGKSVRVTGSKLIKMPYTHKLEGVGPTGYQTVCLVGIQDKLVLADPMRWIRELSEYMETRMQIQGLPREDFTYELRPYGWNAISQQKIEPGSFMPREICIMFIVTAKTQKLATEVAKAWNSKLLHFSTETGRMKTYAFPFSPNEIEKGILYEFLLNHVVHVDSPFEVIRMEEYQV